ncbi:MAG: hypothetical protein PHQ12_01805 [Chthoniobacteraceae bacterium]|nr:hypothetical protein [Chthoniobacteraceae bacterium]
MLRIVALTVVLRAVPAIDAQELAAQPTPFTALVDFAALRAPDAPRQPLPIWLESVQVVPAEPAASSAAPAPAKPIKGLPEEKTAPHTVFRIRLRSLAGLTDRLFLRLYFEDRPDARPTITAWSETGDCKFTSAPLGAGLDLPVSDSLSITTNGANYLEIDVPGDGANVHKALLCPLKPTPMNAALDFAGAPPKREAVADPFGNPTPQPAAENDTHLFGRVRATLEPGVVKLEARAAPLVTATTSRNTSVSFEFNLESAPLLSFVALEILDADPVAPLQAWANNHPLGPVVPHYPDLADPAYSGLVRPLEAMRFRYTGWLPAQVIIPRSSLKAGANIITFQLPSGASPIAIRAVELQLKHPWRSLDYTFTP